MNIIPNPSGKDVLKIVGPTKVSQFDLKFGQKSGEEQTRNMLLFSDYHNGNLLSCLKDDDLEKDSYPDNLKDLLSKTDIFYPAPIKDRIDMLKDKFTKNLELKKSKLWNYIYIFDYLMLLSNNENNECIDLFSEINLGSTILNTNEKEKANIELDNIFDPNQDSVSPIDNSPVEVKADSPKDNISEKDLDTSEKISVV